MLARNIRILDFDGSVRKQKKLLLKYHPEILELEDLASHARIWMNRHAEAAIQERIKDSSPDYVTFLGSGDFHHISSLLINRFKEPISLIVFDFHPDWETLSLRLSCGSWVTQVLRNKNILKCLIFGVSSQDISWPWIQSGNLNSLKKDRLEIYPYLHNPSLVFLRKVPLNKSLRLEERLLSTMISWSELSGKNLRDFFLSQILKLPTKKVYVSIDKDCLKNDYALTNWEEGRLSLNELLLMLNLIKDNLDIVGLDITGDYSKIAVSGILKKLISRLDHPKTVAADIIPKDLVTRTNEATNLKILEVINS